MKNKGNIYTKYNYERNSVKANRIKYEKYYILYYTIFKVELC